MLCKTCLEYKLPMDMHDLELCKNCWVKALERKRTISSQKMIKTRRLNQIARREKSYINGYFLGNNGEWLFLEAERKRKEFDQVSRREKK